MKRLLFALLVLPLLASAALAQAIVQAAPTRLDATLQVAYQTNAVNTVTTCTAVAPAGLYAYITGVSFDVAQNNTGTTAANNTQWTSTNLSGSPIWSFSLAGVANTTTHWQEEFIIPLKAANAGVNVTVVSPAINATAAYTCRIYYYLAP